MVSRQSREGGVFSFATASMQSELVHFGVEPERAGWRRAFIVEYLFYILAILVIGLVCLLTIRFNFKKTDQVRRPNGKPMSKHQMDTDAEFSLKDFKPALDRALMHVRTPWGWPRHEERNRLGGAPPDVSRSTKSYADRLLREKKKNGESVPANSRSKSSIRALLEDRYGRANRQTMTEMQYQKVKAPRLRDPSEPHDQMDNVGTREAERIRQQLKLLTAMNPSSEVP